MRIDPTQALVILDENGDTGITYVQGVYLGYYRDDDPELMVLLRKLRAENPTHHFTLRAEISLTRKS